MNENLELKSISKLLEYNFFIPSYQRGYRWGEEQVLKLLEDILEFSETKTKEEFYPLQPIVVFNDKSKFELIDGQQRITTIYIIFMYLKNIVKKIEKRKEELENLKDIIGVCFGNINSLKDKIPKLGDLIYERNNGKNLNKIDFGKPCIENPDCYYMNSAYLSIVNWFQNKNINIDSFLDTLLNHTKVIWYEISNINEDEKRDIFARLNIGKIELTNAELIRALLLNNVDEYKQKIEIGYELDKIEYCLQDGLFWYFIENKDKDTKIDIIYELLADTYYDEIDEDNKKRFDKELYKKNSFYILEYMLNNNKKTRQEIIIDIEKYFRYLEEWFIDKEFFHKIGYLLTVTNIKLLDFIKKYMKSNKELFREYLNGLIIDEIKNIEIDNLRYSRDNAKIKKILLLFNIQTILENENITYKFDFSKFKTRKNKDDIEHIRSQTDPDIKGKQRKEWIETILKYYYGYTKANNHKNINKLAKDTLFNNFYKGISEKLDYKDNFDEDIKDSIGNLTLLDSAINRSYGNSFFPIKRAIIMEKDRKGTFLSPCTKNVFLKTYSNKISDMMNWNQNDIKSHQKAIEKTLQRYMEK